MTAILSEEAVDSFQHSIVNRYSPRGEMHSSSKYNLAEISIATAGNQRMGWCKVTNFVPSGNVAST